MKSNFLLVLGLCSACDLHDTAGPTSACAVPTELTVTSITGIPSVVSADVKLRGTIARPTDVTIGMVRVGSVDATNQLGDFDEFSAELPLAAITPIDMDSSTATMIELAITATTNCQSGAKQIGTVPIVLAPRSAAQLAIELDAPPASPYLPARSTLLQVRVTADMSSAGALVHVRATSGTLDGAATKDVTLDATGTAKLWFTPEAKEQAVILTASAGSSSSALELEFIGAPVILPSSTPLYVNVPLELQVDGHGGTLAGCRAAAPPNVTVMSGAHDLTDVEQLDDMHVASVTITALAGAVKDSVVTLRCFDVYDQSVTATYTVK